MRWSLLVPADRQLADRAPIERWARQAITEHRDRPDISDSTLPNEATDRIEPADPTLPTLRIEPTDPMDSNEFVEPMLNVD